MFKLLAATALLFAPALAQATTITVENRSARAISAGAPVMPTGYEDLHAVIAPGTTSSAWKDGGKVLVPHDHAPAAAAALAYVDASGSGCRFSVEATRHSSAYAILRPVAEPIGAGRCEARTGSTIGDFVFVMR